MPNFAWENGVLPGTKTDSDPLDPADIPAEFVTASDVNTVFSALTDLRGALWKGGGVIAPRATPPTVGTFAKGDVVMNSSPTTGNVGWVCTVAGTPGTWVTFGELGGVRTQPILVNVEGEGAKFSGTTHSYLSFWPESLAQRGVLGFDTSLDTDLVLLNLYNEGNILIGPGTGGGVYLGGGFQLEPADEVFMGNLAKFFATSCTVGPLGNMLDLTPERVRFPRGAAAPTIGTYAKGDLYFNNDTPGTNVGWVCTVAGTPGTWATFGPPAGGGGVTDHGLLTGLSDDDHAQYALLTGGARAAFTGSISSTGSIKSTVNGIGFDQDNGTIRYQSFVGLGFAWMGSFSNHPFAMFTNNGNAQAIFEVNGGMSIGYTSAQAPSSKLLVNGVIEAATSFKSNVATGTAPLTVASTTKVTNLNADLLDGNDSAAFSLTGHDHAGVYQPLDADLTALAAITGAGDGVATRTAGAWSVAAGGGGGVTDHGALTGLADDDHTQYFLADGTRVATKLDVAGAINRSTAAALAIGDATTTGVNIGRTGQPNTIIGNTGVTGVLTATASGTAVRATDGSRTVDIYTDSTGCYVGTFSTHDLLFYTANGTAKLKLMTSGGDLRIVTTGSSTAGGLRFNDTGNRMVTLGTTAAPTTGTWAAGDIVWSTGPAINGAAGWRCTTAGTPGTWRAFGYMYDELVGTATWNPASLAAGASVSVDVTVTGAALGDYVIACGHPGINVASILLGGVVRAANTVSVTMENRSGAAFDLASGTLTAIVRKAA